MEFTDRKLCSTCTHNMDVKNGLSLVGHSRTICTHPRVIDENKGAFMMVPFPFGCILHEEVKQEKD